LDYPYNLTYTNGPHWFGPRNGSYTVGREGIPYFEPGTGITGVFERIVPAANTFGNIHDVTVDAGTSLGLPDWLVNVPMMPGAYVLALTIESMNTAKTVTGVNLSNCSAKLRR
jgi:hypothetical protein